MRIKIDDAELLLFLLRADAQEVAPCHFMTAAHYDGQVIGCAYRGHQVTQFFLCQFQVFRVAYNIAGIGQYDMGSYQRQVFAGFTDEAGCCRCTCAALVAAYAFIAAKANEGHSLVMRTNEGQWFFFDIETMHYLVPAQLVGCVAICPSVPQGRVGVLISGHNRFVLDVL